MRNDLIAVLEIPEDVRAYAREQALEEHLLAVVEMTRRLFPGCEPRLKIEDDPELPERSIILHVLATGLSVPEAVKARKTWCRELRSVCPGLEAYLFCLRLEMPQ